jgi:hypothetical protein
MLAMVLGSLVLGAFAPKRAAGFAAPAARLLARGFGGERVRPMACDPSPRPGPARRAKE